jgi:glutaredoxin-like protein NrdH
MAQTVRIYTKPDHCMACNMTKAWFAKNNVEYVEEDIYDEAILEAVQALGFNAAPVVIVSQGEPKDDVVWGGFQPEMLKKHVTINTK